MINLGGNAVKFTEKGQVELKVLLDNEQWDEQVLR